MANQIPASCVPLQQKCDRLKTELNDLLNHAGHNQSDIDRLTTQIVEAQNNLDSCLLGNTSPVFPDLPTITAPPSTSSDTALVSQIKTISVAFLKHKFDQFFNNRTDPPIFKVQFDNTGGDNPSSFVNVKFLTQEGADLIYKITRTIDLGQLDSGYYFQDVNSTKITLNVKDVQETMIVIEIIVAFETDGSTELPSTGLLEANIDFSEFYIKLDLSLSLVDNTIDALSWINDIERNIIITPITTVDPDQTRETTTTYRLSGTFMGKTLNETLQFYPDEDYFASQVLHPRIVSNHEHYGGAAQKAMRQKIYNNLKTSRSSFNASVNRWLLGGDGKFTVTDFKTDGDTISIAYQVPVNVLSPFNNMPVPQNWYKPTDFTPGTLANIDHIVVLTMENRSFDHMLGYLSLPIKDGGMGREDVDGLKGGESNTYQGEVNNYVKTTYPSFPFATGDTLFTPDPPHGYEPVFHQVNGGKMDGFVRSYAEEAGEKPGIDKIKNIMGYHTGVNVPIYDALARDFAICQRWFAANPGPTFTNRFYELTGRLNLKNDSYNIPQWELDNSSPLTPVFTPTIFDYLTEYQKHHSKPGSKTVSSNYYEFYYCFLRFFQQHTFDSENILDAEDALKGFFAKARNGTLPSVSFIDPHFIELPPHGNCDGAPANIKDGQELVRRVVEALITSPNWNKTLLIITYDEHGGFYDHVPPPAATKFSEDLPIGTFGVRVPAFIISPWVKQGAVFGHDGDRLPISSQPIETKTITDHAPDFQNPLQSLYFDHTSILKTIAKRFMSDAPPYMGARYAAAKDLSIILDNTARQTQFLPFIKYHIVYFDSQKSLDVQGASSKPGTMLWQYTLNGTIAQDFSFEEAGDGLFYIRTHCGSLYVTVHIAPPVITTGSGNSGNSSIANTNGIVADVKYKAGNTTGAILQSNPDYQKWKIIPIQTFSTEKDLYTISNVFFPDKVLQPVNRSSQSGIAVTLGDKHTDNIHNNNAWKITSPAMANDVLETL